jgi:hypothetical protein
MASSATSSPSTRCAVLAPVAACLAMLVSTSAFAAEAYFQNAIGAREKALAGAGVASSTDATAASLNPAGLATVPSQLNVSASFMILNGGFSSYGVGGFDPDGHYDSKSEVITIPNVAATWRVRWGLVERRGQYALRRHPQC